MSVSSAMPPPDPADDPANDPADTHSDPLADRLRTLATPDADTPSRVMRWPALVVRLFVALLIGSATGFWPLLVPGQNMASLSPFSVAVAAASVVVAMLLLAAFDKLLGPPRTRRARLGVPLVLAGFAAVAAIGMMCGVTSRPPAFPWMVFFISFVWAQPLLVAAVVWACVYWWPNGEQEPAA